MIDTMRHAQQKWAETPVRFRLRILKNARQSLAAQAEDFANTVPDEIPGALHRSQADTLGAEVLPVLEAIRYLEREAAWILRPQRMSSASRPLVLTGVSTEVLRVPLGVVLIIGAANYPLLLAGVQAVQGSGGRQRGAVEASAGRRVGRQLSSRRIGEGRIGS